MHTHPPEDPQARPLEAAESPAWADRGDEEPEHEADHAEDAEIPASAAFDAGPSALPLALDATALAALIGRVMNQDQTAMAALYDALSGRVYACALRLTRQVGLAEEVMQDTFWQVWRQAPRFDAQRGSALAWVLNIARSRALDALRSRQREQQHRLAWAQEEPEDQASDPLDLLAERHRDTQLQATLASLDPLKRQLIALAYYRGLTQDEIAAQTGMPLGTVKSQLRRTLAALREALGSEAAARLGGLA